MARRAAADNRALMDVPALCDFLSCSRRTVYRLVSEGLPHLRLGRGTRARYRFDRGQVHAWLEGPEAISTRHRSTPTVLVEGPVR